MKSQLAKGQAADLASAADKLFTEATEVNGVKLIIGRLPAAPADLIRTQAERLRAKAGSAFITIATDDDGKVNLLVAVSADVVAKGVKAGEVIKQIAEIVGGKGGGKPDMAMAGGKDPAKIDAALAKAREVAAGVLGK